MTIFYLLTILASLPIIAYLFAQKTSNKGIIFGISVLVLSFCLTIFVSKFALVGSVKKQILNNKIFDIDPFVSIDQNGVGELVEIASSRGRKTNKNIKLGICGEHGGDPKSIEFCSRTGLNYVSCSPFRVPVARLAAAQAEISK